MNFTDVFLQSPSVVGATTPNDTSTLTFVLSFISITTASVLWGVNNLTVKHFDTGDGVFFQFVVGLGIFSSGVIVHVFRGFPRLYALPLLSGFCWCNGNFNTVPIIKFLGIGLGTLTNNKNKNNKKKKEFSK